MDFVGVVVGRVVEGVLPPSNNFGQAIVPVLESYNFTVIKKFGPLNKFAKDHFRAVKGSVSFGNSANRPYEVEKSVMINALLKHCVSSKEVWVDLKSFMLLYKDAYGEPLLHEESTVGDVMKYINNSELLGRVFRAEFIHLPIDTGRLSHLNVSKMESLTTSLKRVTFGSGDEEENSAGKATDVGNGENAQGADEGGKRATDSHPSVRSPSSRESSADPGKRYEVERIIGHDTYGNIKKRLPNFRYYKYCTDIKLFYNVKWVGYPDSENSWEPSEGLRHLQIYKDYKASDLCIAMTPQREAAKKTPKRRAVADDLTTSNEANLQKKARASIAEGVALEKGSPIEKVIAHARSELIAGNVELFYEALKHVRDFVWKHGFVGVSATELLCGILHEIITGNESPDEYALTAVLTNRRISLKAKSSILKVVFPDRADFRTGVMGCLEEVYRHGGLLMQTYRCSNNSLELVEVLLNYGINPNCGTEPLLHFAAELGDLQLAAKLIRLGFDTAFRKDGGISLADAAQCKGNPQAAKVFEAYANRLDTFFGDTLVRIFDANYLHRSIAISNVHIVRLRQLSSITLFIMEGETEQNASNYATGEGDSTAGSFALPSGTVILIAVSCGFVGGGGRNFSENFIPKPIVPKRKNIASSVSFGDVPPNFSWMSDERKMDCHKFVLVEKTEDDTAFVYKMPEGFSPEKGCVLEVYHNAAIGDVDFDCEHPLFALQMRKIP